ncbi:MAG: MarR family transcriptional regulator [Ruminococcus sp.]|nr:MarR family transcriptional regulator [Ruminococcus sp.]
MKGKEHHVGFEIRRLDHMISRNLEAQVKAVGIDEITLMHGWIIRYLYDMREQDVFQRDIEKQFSIGRSTVTNIIQLMEKKGLIQREFVTQDARLKKVTLTPKGVKSHETIEKMITALNQKLLKGIREEELSVFLEVAGKIRENIQNEKMEGGIL